jgi:hypothetical protein
MQYKVQIIKLYKGKKDFDIIIEETILMLNENATSLFILMLSCLLLEVDRQFNVKKKKSPCFM